MVLKLYPRAMEFTPDKPIKKGLRWNKTSGLELMGVPSMV